MKKDRIISIAYVVLFLAISLVPLVLFNPKQPKVGNETPVKKPAFMATSGINISFTKETDAYFSRYFGLRNKLVNDSNAIKLAVFKTAGNDSVIVGEDGWLFYGSALKDFIGTENLSDLQIEKAAEVIAQVNEYVSDCGSEFLFFVAPNKMSVYGEYMPYYYKEYEGRNNYDRLYAALSSRDDVNFLNVLPELTKEKLNGKLVYHKLDSHWNNYGAALAYEAAMEKTSYQATDFTSLSYKIMKNHKGDLYGMLLPSGKKKDEQINFDYNFGFEYTSRFMDVDDLIITTSNENAINKANLVMYRDSFGNAFYTFPAQDFATAVFSRSVPYDVYATASNADLVILEIVERNIGNLLKFSPKILAKELSLNDEEIFAAKGELIDEVRNGGAMNWTVKVGPDGDIYMLNAISSYVEDTVRIYIKADDKVYKLMPTMEESVFSGYFDENGYKAITSCEKLSILTENNGVFTEVGANLTLQ